MSGSDLDRPLWAMSTTELVALYWVLDREEKRPSEGRNAHINARKAVARELLQRVKL